MSQPSLKEYSIERFLSAAECNAQSEISLPLLAQRLIEVSTAHANALNIGYDRLTPDGNAWVLSRMNIKIDRMPAINRNYRMITWLESLNRHFSERNVEIQDADGSTIGYARLIWVAINIDSRRPADLSEYMQGIETSDRPCPIDKSQRLPLITEPDVCTTYQFKYSDIDFNRHVNTSRYIQFILDNWDVEFFDRNRIAAFEIAFRNEVRHDQMVEVCRKTDNHTHDIQLMRDGAVCTRAHILFATRPTSAN
jgi:acyl-ACP thioesterase